MKGRLRRSGPRIGRRASYTESLSFGGLSVVSSVLLAIVSSVAVSRLYGVEALGQFTLAATPAYTLQYLASTQEQVQLVRRVALLEPRDPRVTGLFTAVLSFSLGLGLVVGAAGLGITYLLFHGPIDQPGLFGSAALMVAGSVVFVSPAFNLDMLLSAFRAGRELFAARTAQLVLFTVLVFVLAQTSLSGLNALIAATLGSQAFALVQRGVLAHRFLALRVPASEIREGFRQLPDVVKFGLKLAPGSVASGLASQIGTWLLGVYGTLAAIGAYSRAGALATRFLEVSHRIAEVLIPTLAERRHAGDVQGFDRAAVDSLRVSAFASLFPASVAGGAAVGVMNVFGPGFPEAADALAVILLAPALASLSAILDQMLIVADRPGPTSLITMARSVFTLAVSVPLVMELGAAGAAVGWVLGYVIEVVWKQRLAVRELSQPMWGLWTARQLVAQVGCFAAGFGAARVVDQALPQLLGVVPALAAGSLAYLAAFWLLGGLADRDRDRLRAGQVKLRARMAR